MMPIIKWELRHRRTALLWWLLSSIALTVIIMQLYPSIRDQAQQLNGVINGLPQGLRGLKTGNSGSLDVADPIAFLNSQLFYATLPILWIILAITRGSSILGRDEQNHTLELLLARPVSRLRVLGAKVIALICEMAIVAGLTLLAIILFAPFSQLHVATVRLLAVTIYTGAFALSFGLIAFALQAANRFSRRMATVFAVFLSFGGYIVASLSGLTHWLRNPAKLAPFHYFEPEKIMRGQAVTGLNIYLALVVIVCGALAVWSFRRRDIE